MKVLTTALAIALSLCPAAAASGRDVGSRGPQGLPGPGQLTPATQTPRSRGPQGLPGPPQSSPSRPDAALTSPDRGHSAATVVLISLGGTLTLIGAAYGASRLVHRRRVAV